MIRGAAIPNKRIINESEQRQAPPAPRPQAAATLEASTEQTPADRRRPVGPSGRGGRPALAPDVGGAPRPPGPTVAPGSLLHPAQGRPARRLPGHARRA